MREIKFRAWDGKEMWTGFNILPADIIVPPAWKKSKENLEYMQFTGLLDKNSKEIYEGDVVVYCGHSNCKGIPEEHTIKQTIEWPHCFRMTAPQNRIVIGNIYEHPELLTK